MATRLARSISALRFPITTFRVQRYNMSTIPEGHPNSYLTTDGLYWVKDMRAVITGQFLSYEFS